MGACRSSLIAPLATLLFAAMALLPGERAEAVVAKPVLSVSIGLGGESLKGEGLSEKTNCAAGNQLGLSAGGLLELSNTRPHVFETQLTLGILWGSGGDGNKSTVDFTRVPLELMSYYRNADLHFRVGYGASYQFANRLSGQGPDAGVSTTFDNALGYVLAAESISEGGFGWGFRYTNIHYHSQRTGQSYLGEAYILSFQLAFSGN